MAKYDGGEVSTTGTTWVTVFDGVASKRRPLDSLEVVNRDTVLHTITFRYNKGGSPIVEFAQIVLQPVANFPANVGAVSCAGKFLDAADESIQMKSDATATVTEPMAFAKGFEEP